MKVTENARRLKRHGKSTGLKEIPSERQNQLQPGSGQTGSSHVATSMAFVASAKTPFLLIPSRSQRRASKPAKRAPVHHEVDKPLVGVRVQDSVHLADVGFCGMM
jgi:hypothetical protein